MMDGTYFSTADETLIQAIRSPDSGILDSVLASWQRPVSG
jgi:hypothetical protein